MLLSSHWRHGTPPAGCFEHCLMCRTENPEDNYQENIRSSQEDNHRYHLPYARYYGKHFIFILSLHPYDSNTVPLPYRLRSWDSAKLGDLFSLITNKWWNQVFLVPKLDFSLTTCYGLFVCFDVEGDLKEEVISESHSTYFFF